MVKLRQDFAIFLLLSVISCFGIHGTNSVTVITQPDNTTVCEGGTAVFTCEMDILNVNVSPVDVKWRRRRIYQAVNVTVNTQGLPRLNVNNSISQGTLTIASVLMITDVRSTDIGPYWCVLMINNELIAASNMAFLNIGTTTTTDCTSTSMITITNTTIMATIISTATSSITTTNNVMSTVANTPNFTVDGGANDGSGGSSAGAIIAGGVIGGIIVVVIIVIIIIVIYYLVFYRNKDNDDGKSPYYSVITSRSGSNGKNTLAVSNSVCDEAHKTEGKTVPHQTTDTGELYAMSTKDTHDEPQLLYTYARVDLDTKRKITETSVPHETAGDGVQYAVSTKAAAKVTDKDVDENTENEEIKYADLQPLPTPSDIRHVTNKGSSQYIELVT